MYYVIYDQGSFETKSTYETEGEALAQAQHDMKYGFGVPLRIEGEEGRVLHTTDELKLRASQLK